MTPGFVSPRSAEGRNRLAPDPGEGQESSSPGRLFHETPIYLDYSATTPVDPRVAEKMCACLTPDGVFGNAASRSHPFGWAAGELVRRGARANVAALVGADPVRSWTSGATESDNLAIKGAGTSTRSRAGINHPEDRAQGGPGQSVASLSAKASKSRIWMYSQNGLPIWRSSEAAIRPDTILVSVMHVNNEIGVIQTSPRSALSAGERKVPFHVDAAQSPGKGGYRSVGAAVDLMSFLRKTSTGRKDQGPCTARRKPRIRLEAQMHGGA